MNKHNFPLAAIVLALAGPAFAQSTVQIYGTVDAFVGQLDTQDPAGGPGSTDTPFKKVKGVHNGGIQTSFWGLRGSEDLGNGLKARFQLEGFFRVDTGAQGRFDANPGSGAAADAQWSRVAYVALGSQSLGEVKLGNTPNPTWVSLIQTNALGANSVFSPNFRQLYNGGTRGRSEVDTSLVNSVQYSAPMFAGLTGNVALQAGEGSGHKYSYNANIVYRAGPFMATAAVQKVNHAAPPNVAADRNQQMLLVGGSYDLGFARLFAQYVDIDNDRLLNDDKVPSFGATVPLLGGSVQLGVARDKQTYRGTAPFTTAGSINVNSTRTTATLGYTYPLSKRTELYTFLMEDKVKNSSRTTGATTFDDKGDSYAVGMRHQF